MTEIQMKVLRFLAKAPATGVELAWHLWPNSKGWHRQVKSACGVRSNEAGMSRPAKGICRRLINMGLVYVKNPADLTQCQRFDLQYKGKQLLEGKS